MHDLVYCRSGVVSKLFLGAVLVAGGIFAFQFMQEAKKKEEDSEKKESKGGLWKKK
jgi:hypothetical protein